MVYISIKHAFLPFSRPLNTDTWIIRTLWHVPLVSVLTGLHCTSQKQREDYNFFYLTHPPPPLYLQDRIASNNSPPPGPKGRTCPGGCPVGMVTSKIKPCIKQGSILINTYYSFKIFPQFRLAKSTCIIHHNQLRMTKFGRIVFSEEMTSKMQPTTG